MDHIYCLAVRGGLLTPEMSTTLFRIAQVVMEDKDKAVRVKYPDFQGEVRTEYKLGHVANITGFVFNAIIDHGSKTIRAEFIVKPLKRKVWEGKDLYLDPTPVHETDPSLN